MTRIPSRRRARSASIAVWTVALLFCVAVIALVVWAIVGWVR